MKTLALATFAAVGLALSANVALADAQRAAEAAEFRAVQLNQVYAKGDRAFFAAEPTYTTERARQAAEFRAVQQNQVVADRSFYAGTPTVDEDLQELIDLRSVQGITVTP